MTQLPNVFLKTMGFNIDNPKDQLLVTQSLMEHTRNGRGFWPVIQVGGIPQVLRFSTGYSKSQRGQGQEARRWTPETGVIDLVPLHSLSVVDWPHVRMAC